MKLLEKGPGWSTIQYCTGKGNGNGGCMSKFLVEKEDIYLTSHTDLTGKTDYYYTFKCPICGVQTDIPENEIPLGFKKELLESKKGLYRRLEWR